MFCDLFGCLHKLLYDLELEMALYISKLHKSIITYRKMAFITHLANFRLGRQLSSVSGARQLQSLTPCNLVAAAINRGGGGTNEFWAAYTILRAEFGTTQIDSCVDSVTSSFFIVSLVTSTLT